MEVIMDKEQYRQFILKTLETSLEIQLRSIRQLLGKDDFSSGTTSKKGRRRKSLVDLTIQLLTEEQRAIHIDGQALKSSIEIISKILPNSKKLEQFLKWQEKYML